MTTRLDLDEVLKTVIDQVMLRLEAEGVSALLLDNPAELVFAAVNGASADKLRGTRMPATAGIAGEVMRTGQALRIRIGGRSRSASIATSRDVSQYHALDVVAVPLKLGSEILGVMEAVHSQAHSFTDDDLRLLESAGSWAAIAIGNARQHQRLQRRLRESEVMAAIGRALERDARSGSRPAADRFLGPADHPESQPGQHALAGRDPTRGLCRNRTRPSGALSERRTHALCATIHSASMIEAGQVVNIPDLQQFDVPWPRGYCRLKLARCSPRPCRAARSTLAL